MPREKRRFGGYQKRSMSDVTRRSEQASGLYDTIFREGVSVLVTKPDTKHTLRFLPPGWKDAKHFGLDIHVNYGIGPDNQSYLSLARMKDAADPIDEERRRAVAAGEEDVAKALRTTRRVACWVIDRDDEDAGPKLWSMPASVDRELALRMTADDVDGDYLAIDDPVDGFDVTFKRTGQGLTTKYEGVAIARRSTPLHSDDKVAAEWLDYITDNAVPDVLNFYSYDHIEKTLHGGKDASSKSDKDEEEDDDGPAAAKAAERLRRQRVAKGDDAPPKREPAKDDEEDELPW